MQEKRVFEDDSAEMGQIPELAMERAEGVVGYGVLRKLIRAKRNLQRPV